MKKTVLTTIAVATAIAHNAQMKPAIPRDEAIEAKIENTLSKMTLDDKVGQMLELNIDIFGSNKGKGWEMDKAKMDSAIKIWRIGSVLNAPGTRAATVQQWQAWIPYIQKQSMRHLGIPSIYGLDNNHGSTYIQGGTLFPQPINVAASFNTELARTTAEVTAYESRAADCPWVYNPTIDLGRDPRWPRLWESYGEDPVVESRMVEAAIAGYQGSDPNHLGKYNVATSVKHYLAYGAPFSGKDRTPAYVAPQVLREKYFAPFKAAAQAGALTFMANSASVNGVPVHASYEYLTQWLKNDLNWDGMIVTDWADINNLYTREHVAKDKKEAIKIAINAGIDMSMDPYDVDFCTLLKELVNEGQVKMSRIDDAVRRILRVKYRLGLFDTPNTGGKDYAKFGSDDFALKALHAAEESEVLLKNDDGTLPIARGTKILVTGPNANQMRCLDGGWSYTWQGSGAEDLASKYNTIYEALCNKYGRDNVTLEQGVTYNEKGHYWEENTPHIDKAVAAAQGVDVIVACIGENSYTETPGNLTDLTLSKNQRDLVKALAKTGKPIVLILNEGRPRLIADIEPLAKAVVNVLLPGNYGADALANLLSGEVNFSAKMPYTYPKEINSLINYDYKVSEEVSTMAGAYDYDAKVTQQWPFGYGLSYSTFEYKNLQVDGEVSTADQWVNVSFEVKNTGSMAADEVAQVYLSPTSADQQLRPQQLQGFARVSLQPGQTRRVKMRLCTEQFGFYTHQGERQWNVRPGTYTVKVGASSADIKLQKNVTLKGETVSKPLRETYFSQSTVE